MSCGNTIFCGVKWVFIDLDDTLWDFSANSDVALRMLYEEYPILKELYPDYEEYDEVYHQKNAEMWDLYHHGKISQDFLKKERFRFLLVNKGFVSDNLDSFALELNEWYLNALSDCTTVVDGAFELLEHLKNKYLVGVLSNGFLNVQYKKLYGSGLYRFIQRMVVSDEIGVQKPDKRIFDYALEATGANSENVLMIGDNPDADIKGAKDAGWRTIYFDRKNRGVMNTTPDLIVDKLIDIISCL